MQKHHIRLLAAAGLGAAAVALVAGCASNTATSDTPVPLASNVDIARYMGTWYVIGNIPTFLERDVRDAADHYRLEQDGSIDISYSYRKLDGDGEVKRLRSRGFVSQSDKAVWGVQFVWPIKADYRIAYLSPDYGQTIVARDKRDYVWIMSRTPTIPQAQYQALLARVAAMGYDVSKMVRVPQSGTP